MNKVYKLKWNKNKNTWDVCSELGRRASKNKSSAILVGAVLLSSMSAYAADTTINKDTTIDFGTENQVIDYVINVTDNATVRIEAPSSNPRLTISSGGGLNITSGKVYLSDNLNFLMNGTGYLNVTGPESVLYAPTLRDSLVNSNRRGGSFSVLDGGKIYSERIDASYSTGKVSGQGSQINADRFFIGANGSNSNNINISVDDHGEINSSKISIGYYDQNTDSTLVVSNNGKISADEISLSTNSELALGAKEGSAAQSAGVIDAKKISFVWNSTTDKKITLNHTSDNAEISADISSGTTGLGYINAFSGTTILSGDNSAFSGTTNINKNGALEVTNNLGTSRIYNNGKLSLSTTDGMNFGNTMSGNGVLSVKQGDITLSGNNSAFQGTISVEENAKGTVTEQNNLGKSVLSVNGELHIDSENDWTLTNVTSGNGILSVDTNNNNFSFANDSVVNGFNGYVSLQNTQFSLDGVNTSALSTSGLMAGTGSNILVGSGKQSIGKLAFSGGTINFGSISPGSTASQNTIEVNNTLDLTGSGFVQLDISGEINHIPTDVDTNTNILKQDDENSYIKLASAEKDATVIGSGGNIQIKDKNGDVITNGVKHDILQNGNKVAEGTYDYRMTSGENGDGLYVGYGLTEVNLIASGDDALVLDATGSTGNAADMSAKITGSGDLIINSQSGHTLSLSNKDNSYSGITDVRGGSLLMLNDNVLGNTAELRLNQDTSLDMNGHSQTIGEISSKDGSLINLNGGSLTVEKGGVIDGNLTGNGKFAVSSGSLTINKSNATLTAETTIANGANVSMNNTTGLGLGSIINSGLLSITDAIGTLSNKLSDSGVIELVKSNVSLTGDNRDFTGSFNIDNSSKLSATSAGSLGTASIKNDGELSFNTDTSWKTDNHITGSGSVTKTGSGVVHLTNKSEWTGKTDILEGGLVVGSTDAPVTLASSQINISENAFLSGVGGTLGNVDNAGVLQVGYQGNAKATPTSQQFTIAGDLNNSGSIQIGQPNSQVGNQLIVNGNYTGNNGHLSLNTVLNDDKSSTDKLIINGDSSGTTSVSITNAGGSGAQTLNGIEVIKVNGKSEGEFTQAGRIVAGAYDYTLARGEGANSSNWYLTSQKSENDLRPEAGSYIANLASANTMFNMSLNDRTSTMPFMKATHSDESSSNMWMRHTGGKTKWRDTSGQLQTQSNRYTLQLGGDVAKWSLGDKDMLSLGVMAGYGHSNSRTHSSMTDYTSKGNTDGYTTGVYATWFANNETKDGLYLDSWAQYNWFDNTINGKDLQTESYKSKGMTASLEAGFTHKVKSQKDGKGAGTDWFIQPQAQVILMDVQADNHQESNGTKVEADNKANVQTRLGVKTWLTKTHKMQNGDVGEISPFAEVNWIHNSHNFGTKLDGVAVRQSGAKDIGEVKLGIQGQVNSQMNIWGNVSVQAGSNGYSDTAAMLGVQWRF